jgi:hypothetical protein
MGKDLGAFEVEERANDGGGGCELARAGDAGEAGEAGAAENVEENGFGLVVGGVSRGDIASAEFVGGFGQEIIAGLPGSGFEAVGGVCGKVRCGAGDRVFEIELCGERADEGFVGLGGGAAEAVVEVGDDEAALARVGSVKGVQAAEEGNAVGAAGDGDKDGQISPAGGGPGGLKFGFESGRERDQWKTLT